MHRKCTARQIKCQDEVGKRNDAWGEARALLRGEYGLGIDRRVEADLEQLFFDLKRKLLKKWMRTISHSLPTNIPETPRRQP
jgi:hypothetical protein